MPHKVVVFSRAYAIQYKADVPAANEMTGLLARRTGPFQRDFSPTMTYSTHLLNPKMLARYDAIIMNSTAHLAIPDAGHILEPFLNPTSCALPGRRSVRARRSRRNESMTIAARLKVQRGVGTGR